MNATIAAAVEKLDKDERLALIDELWDTVDECDLTPAMKAELDRRIRAFEDGTEQLIPWEQVRAELRDRYGW